MEAVVRLEASGSSWQAIQEMTIAQIRGRLAVIEELNRKDNYKRRAEAALDLRAAVASLFDQEASENFSDHIQVLLEAE